MKMKCITLIFFLSVVSGCANTNWTYNGIRLETIKEHPVKTAAGLGAAFAVHTAGHAIYLNSQGVDWHFEGYDEIIDEPLTGDQKQWNGRAGALMALGVGYTAKCLGATGPFWQAYYSGVAFQTIAYPIFDSIGEHGDISLIDSGGGQGLLEWSLYSLAALDLILDTKQTKPEDPMATASTIEFCGELKWETDTCYKVFDGIEDTWIKKSLVEKMIPVDRSGNFKFIIPSWYARSKKIV